MSTENFSESPVIGSLNRAKSEKRLNLEEMYQLVTRQNTTWGVQGYEVPKKYLDPLEMKKEREGKLVQKAPVATKRGNFIDDELKAHKGVPGPYYNISGPWMTDDEIKKLKGMKKSYGDRHTFLDDMTRIPKEKRYPGPGAYNLIKTDKEIEDYKNKLKSKKLSQAERSNFLNEYQYLAYKIPGPGMYNPKAFEFKPSGKVMMKPEDWLRKHAEELKKVKEIKKSQSSIDLKNLPAPLPVDYDTFEKSLRLAQSQTQKGLSKSKLFGTEKRFTELKRDDKDHFTGPGKYDLIASWAGKLSPGQKSDKKEPDWMKRITKGISKSIYYDNN